MCSAEAWQEVSEGSYKHRPLPPIYHLCYIVRRKTVGEKITVTNLNKMKKLIPDGDKFHLSDRNQLKSTCANIYKTKGGKYLHQPSIDRMQSMGVAPDYQALRNSPTTPASTHESCATRLESRYTHERLLINTFMNFRRPGLPPSILTSTHESRAFFRRPLRDRNPPERPTPPGRHIYEHTKAKPVDKRKANAHCLVIRGPSSPQTHTGPWVAVDPPTFRDQCL